MRHTMKLKSQYYNYIVNGTKRIEIRLNDEKRSKIKIGDTIKFLKDPNFDESIEVKVIDLLKYDSFSDLINNHDVSILSDKSMDKENIILALEKFYPPEKQFKYGVLGIKFKLL